jgi:hypothetical protein
MKVEEKESKYIGSQFSSMSVNENSSKQRKLSSNLHAESCPELPEISKVKHDTTTSKISSKSKKSPPKYAVKYGVKCKL